MDKGALIFSVIAIVFIALIIGINILIGRYIIHRALKKRILPTLEQNGLIFLRYQWLGLLNSGYFENLEFKFGISRSGKSSLSIYIDVYYQDHGISQKATV